jgi:hypothetical protein
MRDGRQRAGSREQGAEGLLAAYCELLAVSLAVRPLVSAVKP